MNPVKPSPHLADAIARANARAKEREEAIDKLEGVLKESKPPSESNPKIVTIASGLFPTLVGLFFATKVASIVGERITARVTDAAQQFLTGQSSTIVGFAAGYIVRAVISHVIEHEVRGILSDSPTYIAWSKSPAQPD